jgi:hypothetical protein
MLLKVSSDLSSNGTRAGKTGMDMEPKTHGYKVTFDCCTGQTIEKDPMTLEKIANTHF